MDVFKLHRGSAPLLISLPHDGSAIPDAISARLTDGARGSLYQDALARADAGSAVQELVRGRPAQDQRGRLRRVEARRHAGQAVSPQRTIGGVRPDHRHIGHAVANLKVAHALAELIDFPDHVVAHYERRPEAHRLRV